MYLTNHSDKDMRKYTYAVVNQTVAIFCAVLLFSIFDDLVEWLVSRNNAGEGSVLGVAVAMLHMTCWFAVLQLAIAWMCRVLWFRRDSDDPDSVEREKPAVKCYAVLISHLTGFASINAWGMVQQLAGNNPILVLLVVPISFIVLHCLSALLDRFRETLALMDENMDAREELWHDECLEAANDVAALTLSFNMMQAIRFSINGVLPDVHGKENWADLHNHTSGQVAAMYVVALVCISLMVFVYLQQGREQLMSGQEGDHFYDSSDEEVCNDVESQGQSTGYGNSVTCTKTEDEILIELDLTKVANILTISFGMAFAWGIFYASQMWLAMHLIVNDPMVLGVSLALAISFGALLVIRSLDKLDDLVVASSSQVVIKSVFDDGFLYVDTSLEDVENSAMLVRKVSKHSMTFSSVETGVEVNESTRQFAASSKKAKPKPKKRSVLTRRDVTLAGNVKAIQLRHGNHYLCQDGHMRRSRDGADEKSGNFPTIERSHNQHVRIQVGQEELDVIPRESRNSVTMDAVLKVVIRALGILVGFAWEQCFDQAVDDLSDVCPNKHLARLVLAAACILIIVPAWKWYVLPMYEQEGWRFGFVFDEDDGKWSDVVRMLQRRELLRNMNSGGSSANRQAFANSRKSCFARRFNAPEDASGATTPLLPKDLLRSQASSEAAAEEVAKLQRMQDQLKNAAEGFLDLYRTSQQAAGSTRKCMLQQYNEQMDNMLERMQAIHRQVAADAFDAHRADVGLRSPPRLMPADAGRLPARQAPPRLPQADSPGY